MANTFSDQKSNRNATPPVKNQMEFAGGRVRSKLVRFKAGAAFAPAQNDVLFTETFQLGDVISEFLLYNSVAQGVTLTVSIGPFVPKVLETDTAVLSPISGGTAGAARFCLATVINSIGTPAAPQRLWLLGSTPVFLVGPLWEQLGYASYEAALVDIPGGAIDLGVTVAAAAGTSAIWQARIVYNSGD